MLLKTAAMFLGCCLLLQNCAPADKRPARPNNLRSEHSGSRPVAGQSVRTASVADWVSRNLEIELADSVFKAAGLTDTTFFTADIPERSREKLLSPFFLGEKPLKEVSVRPGVITVNLSDEENKHLFITGNYVIVSCHLLMGNNGGSLVYHLRTQQLEELSQTVSGVLGEHTVEAWFDYYEETGHVWETGAYDIPTGKFRRTSIER